MSLALSQVRVDSLLGASCPGCEVRVDQGESPGCELTCYRPRGTDRWLAPNNKLYYEFLFQITAVCYAVANFIIHDTNLCAICPTGSKC